MELHRETSEALGYTIDDQEKENAKMKQSIYKLEASLSPWPFFIEPLPIIHSVEESPIPAYKIDKVTRLLSGTNSFVV